jgi:signal transduction histidine kinase/ActR/RegA family two-component response regulator
LLLEHYRAVAHQNSETWREQIGQEREQLLAAQAELKNSESRFKAFSELASDWLFELDKDLTYTFATSRGLEIMAAPNDIKLSELRTDMLERDVLADMLQGKEIHNEQVSFYDYNGKLVHVLFSARPLHDAAGVFTGYIGAGTDITGMKQAEEALRKKEQELQHIQKLEALGRLTSGVAHDFNNLLAVIGGSLEMLEGEQTAKDRSKIEASLRAVNRAAELTQQLLSFARKQALEPKNVQLAAVFNNVTQMCNRTLEASIKVETSLEEDVWDCYADVGQLENALLNLILNARDAMHGKGVIRLAARNVAMTEGELAPGDYVEIAVQDTGHGIANDDLERITEPFFTTKPSGQGTGLGMSMVYGFAQQSGGKLKTSSTIGEGSTFSILLPRGEVAQAVHSAQKRDQSLLQGTVLLVDDDPAVMKVLCLGLERMGLTVHGFASAEEALEALPMIQPQVIITDLMLGEGMNGVQLADVVAANHGNLPVILVSGNPDQLLQGEAYQRYAKNLLSKPFSQQKLAALVREKLEEQRQPSLETRIQSG